MYHNEEHYTGTAFLRDVVIGMSDGLTVPFALAAGLSGAVDNNDIIVTAGIAEIIAGSIAMGLGGYLAGRTEIQHYDSELKREYYEVNQFPEPEKKEIQELLEGYGISAETGKKVADELARDKKQWVDFMMKYELGLEKPDAGRARGSALTIGLSYITGGIVPLLPYIFASTPHTGLLWSCSITLLFLAVFGFIKSRLLQQNPWSGALRMALIGALASGAAYLVTKWFEK